MHLFHFSFFVLMVSLFRMNSLWNLSFIWINASFLISFFAFGSKRSSKKLTFYLFCFLFGSFPIKDWANCPLPKIGWFHPQKRFFLNCKAGLALLFYETSRRSLWSPCQYQFHQFHQRLQKSKKCLFCLTKARSFFWLTGRIKKCRTKCLAKIFLDRRTF